MIRHRHVGTVIVRHFDFKNIHSPLTIGIAFLIRTTNAPQGVPQIDFIDYRVTKQVKQTKLSA